VTSSSRRAAPDELRPNHAGFIARTSPLDNEDDPRRRAPQGRPLEAVLERVAALADPEAVADEVTRTMELPETDHVPDDEGDYPLQSAHHGIDVSGDGEYVAAAGTTSWYLAIVRRSDFEPVDSVAVGEHPYWVKTAPDGKHAFVLVRGEDEVSVINYEAAEEVPRVPVGAQPHVIEHGTVPRDVL
jgi:hypothetical protein